MRRPGVLVVLLLAGCGGGAPSEVVPADATIYIGVDAQHAERLMPETSREDVEFQDDVEPWLGDRAAYFAIGPRDTAGLVFDAEDEEAAEAFGRKATSGGPMRASAVIDGRLVLASTPELLRAAAAAARSGSLADSAKLDVAGEEGDGAPDLLIAAEQPPVVARGFELMKAIDRPDVPDEALGDGPMTARVWDEPRRLEVAGLPAHSDTAPTLANVPGAAWLAFASADLGEDAALAREHEQYAQIEQLTGLDLERSVLPHLGAGMLFVQGRTPAGMGGRLVAEVADEGALRRLARRSIRYRVRIADGRLTLDFGVAPGGVAEDLDDTPAYRDAVRRLGGAPTFLLTDEDGYQAARDAVEDGRRVVRYVSVDQPG